VPPQAPRSDACNSTINGLNEQDTYLKTLVEGSNSLAFKQQTALRVKVNLQTYLERLPRACQPAITDPLSAEVNQRIGQIDDFARTGVWVGPVGS